MCSKGKLALRRQSQSQTIHERGSPEIGGCAAHTSGRLTSANSGEANSQLFRRLLLAGPLVQQSSDVFDRRRSGSGEQKQGFLPGSLRPQWHGYQ